MQILTEAEAEEFWQKKMLKKGHCLGKAHCIYSDNTVYYTVYIRVVATTPEKTHNQKFLTFETIFNRFFVQF